MPTRVRITSNGVGGPFDDHQTLSARCALLRKTRIHFLQTNPMLAGVGHTEQCGLGRRCQPFHKVHTQKSGYGALILANWQLRLAFLFTMSNATLATRKSRNRKGISYSSHTGKNGGASRDRTDDLKLAKLPLSQLSYGPDRMTA